MILQELKYKYPLAIEAIKFPVAHESKTAFISDSKGEILCFISGKNIDPETQSQIGQLIEELINQLNV